MLDAVPEVSVEMEGVAVALVVSEMARLLEYTTVSIMGTVFDSSRVTEVDCVDKAESDKLNVVLVVGVLLLQLDSVCDVLTLRVREIVELNNVVQLLVTLVVLL